MTTVTIDDELAQLAREAASVRGKTLDEFAVEALQRALSGSARRSIRRVLRNGIPVMLVPSEQTPIDPDKVRRSLEEEGF